MKFPLYLFALTALFVAGCDNKSANPAPGTSPANAASDYVGALGRGQAKALNTVDLASLTQAVQMFNVNEGRFPKDLNELVEAKLIARIPQTPNGMKLAYDPATGKVSMVPE